MNVGDVVTLRGKSLKGRNRVREYGTEWRVLGVPYGTVAGQFLLGHLSGHLLLGAVSTYTARRGHTYMRWLHPSRDPHFEIVPDPAETESPLPGRSVSTGDESAPDGGAGGEA